MSIDPKGSDHQSNHWSTRTPRIVVSLINFLFIGLGLAVLNNVISNLVTPALPQLIAPSQHIVTWLSHNLVITGLILIIITLLHIICDLQIKYEGIELPLSERQAKHYYFKYVKEETKTLAPEGLPSHLRGLSTQLDAIFVAPEFYPNLPLTDHPPQRDELKAAYLSQQDHEIWRYTFDENYKIDLPTLWQNLTKEKSAAVIQGYPGIGKSTLLARLALYMAERWLKRWYYTLENAFSRLKLPDSVTDSFHIQKNNTSGLGLPNATAPSLTPILINLREYAEDKRTCSGMKSSKNPVMDYLENFISARFQIPETFLQKCLQRGSCLIMFDGLDEVSKDLRVEVQKDITEFIRYCCAKTQQIMDYNRFLITSRVADSDQNAFPDQNFSHYMMADLKSEQIQKLINKYYDVYTHEYSRFSLLQDQEKRADEAKRRADLLSLAIKQDLHIADLAKRPLLLYLLIIVLVSQEKIDLPRQRIKLYEIAVQLLLEGHSLKRNLPQIEEWKAIQALGLLAVKMKDQGKIYIHHDDVVSLLKQSLTITTQEAEAFLTLVRERSGLFVRRVDNEFGFYHNTFEDYFAARYKLLQIDGNADELQQFVKDGLTNDRWSNALLLAITYESYQHDGEELTRSMISSLANALPRSNSKNRISSLLLCIECMFEAKPSTIKDQFKVNIANKLIRAYEKALRNKQFEYCYQFQNIIKRWFTYAIEERSLSLLGDVLNKHSSLSLIALIAEQPLPDIHNVLESHIQPYGSNPATSAQPSPHTTITNGTVPTEEDSQRLARAICEWLASSECHSEVRKILMLMLQHTHLHSPEEVRFTRYIAENTLNQDIHHACANALQECTLKKPEMISAMQHVALSTLIPIRDAANTWLRGAKPGEIP